MVASLHLVVPPKLGIIERLNLINPWLLATRMDGIAENARIL